MQTSEMQEEKTLALYNATEAEIRLANEIKLLMDAGKEPSSELIARHAKAKDVVAVCVTALENYVF